MKRYTVLFGILIILLIIVAFLFFYQSKPLIVRETPKPIIFRESPPYRSPEFREPPLKRYKPRRFQQMGLLTNDDGSTLPLYGRESRTHRDRYHYYTTTPGEQIYSLPITYNDRDCTEDIGCPEFYGNESVSVTGQSGNFSTNIYRTENFPQFY